jgi:hypothetical protein
MKKAIRVNCLTEEFISILDKVVKTKVFAQVVSDNKDPSIDQIILMYEPSISAGVSELLRNATVTAADDGLRIADMKKRVLEFVKNQIWGKYVY